MKKLLRPRVILPAIFAAAVIAALLAFSDLGKVVRLMEGFNRLYLLYFFLLMVAYELVRGLQWQYLLHALKIRVPIRAQWFSFLVGEMGKSLPIGNYLQNYLLERAQGADFGRSSAASTLIIITEVFVSVIGVVILGLGSWTTFLRPIIIIGLILTGVAVFLIVKFHHSGNPPRWMTKRKAMQKVLQEFGEFEKGAVDLFKPRVLAVEIALSATYLIIAGAGLYIILRGLNIGGASFGEALAVYFFSLATSLIIPIPVDIGVIEITAVGAFLVVGVSRAGAVGTVLINRVLSIIASIAIAIIAMIVFHDQLRAALKDRPRRGQKGEKGQNGQKDTQSAQQNRQPPTDGPQDTRQPAHAS